MTTTTMTSLLNDTDLDFEDDDYLIEDDATRAEKYADDLEAQFAILPMAICADVRARRLTTRDIFLYLHLLSKQGRNKHSFWGIDALALLTGVSPSTIKDSLRRLAECGHIRRVPRGASSTRTVCLTKMKGKKLYIRGKAIGASKEKERSSTTEPVAHRRQSPAAQTLPEDYLEREDTKAFLREADGFFASYGENSVYQGAGISYPK